VVCIEAKVMIATLDPVHPHVCAGSTFRARSRIARRCNARRKVCCLANDTAYYAAGSPPHAHSHRKKVVIVGGIDSLPLTPDQHAVLRALCIT